MSLFASMLVAVDGSAPSGAALAAACSLAKDYGGRLTGCHVLELAPHLQGRHVSWLPEAEADRRREALAIARRAEETAADVYGLSLRVNVTDGDPIEELLNAAAETAADTIIIGDRGQGSLSTLLLGSVAQGVTQRSVLPVLVVHDRASLQETATQPLRRANSR